ncbi:HAD-IA family hydrolase [Erwiniaceae bacterium BAC15a-03b]|uniref:HAD-IA family hydrolase n=1 Tax=Winslowiella arboricola TaxID=2978220 RepID=A0A9J6PL10_9GAMM|nr:HAD-IA family hydrolase [Winslowiella arboricola]MCU5771503.1 HAD-IA family hydrolase [Winslowiella arboricola]MCU5776376.1 HAD-IA family hydrolase [Winslowiella arboricola]
MDNSLELIIFDCDGVLVDSEIIGIRLTVSLLNQHGVDMGFDEFTRDYSGLAWGELIDKVRSDKDVKIDESIHQQFSAQLMAAFADSLSRIAGTDEVISGLSTRKCICSNSGAEQLDYMLSLVGLKHLFAADIFSAVDLGPGRAKPQPDIFLHAAEVMQATPANTMVIEDSVHGVMAAKRAGMYVIGFTGGAHTNPSHRARLEAAGADRVIDSMYRLNDEIVRFRQRAQ